jgi:hypothetical protein
LGGRLVFGNEPSTTLDETCGSAATTTTTGTSGGTPPTLTAQYASTSAAASTSQISNKIQVTNIGTTNVPLSAITVRYWFTEDSTAGLQYACDYAPLDCANVTASFGTVSPAVTGADHYLQIGFTSGAGTLYAGNDTGAIQNRFFQSTYGNFNQADDYSYNAAATSLTTWNHITVYYNGTLVYGTPPS